MKTQVVNLKLEHLHGEYPDQFNPLAQTWDILLSITFTIMLNA
jgi:hypothetical protein